MEWDIEFITKNDFEEHVRNTIRQYGSKLKSIDLKKFNSNIIDPIKFLFDKNLYNLQWEEIIKNEIFRQRDKSNSNDIGYFHQNIFKYITNCEVPATGWDIIFRSENGIPVANQGVSHNVYCELKNKHNTMNSASAASTYIKMQNQLLEDDDCICYLVEVISKKSQDIPWEKKVGSIRYKKERIRKISIDKFYEIVTGDRKAFYKICLALPEVIEEILLLDPSSGVEDDTVIDELRDKHKRNGKNDLLMAMYFLGFESYAGFEKFNVETIQTVIGEYDKPDI